MIVVPVVEGVLAGMKIYTVFDLATTARDCVEASSDCSELGIKGAQTVSDALAESVISDVLDKGADTFEFVKRDSGLYAASGLCDDVLITPGATSRGIRRKAEHKTYSFSGFGINETISFYLNDEVREEFNRLTGGDADEAIAEFGKDSSLFPSRDKLRALQRISKRLENGKDWSYQMILGAMGDPGGR